MSHQQPEDTRKPETRERPPHDRVFYANALNYAINLEQEAILDFMLVGPEDFNRESQSSVQEEEEKLVVNKSISLKDQPIEVRVYMPINQFMIMCKRMARLWQKLDAPEEGQTQGGEIEQMETQTK